MRWMGFLAIDFVNDCIFQILFLWHDYEVKFNPMPLFWTWYWLQGPRRVQCLSEFFLRCQHYRYWQLYDENPNSHMTTTLEPRVIWVRPQHEIDKSTATRGIGPVSHHLSSIWILHVNKCMHAKESMMYGVGIYEFQHSLKTWFTLLGPQVWKRKVQVQNLNVQELIITTYLGTLQSCKHNTKDHFSYLLHDMVGMITLCLTCCKMLMIGLANDHLSSQLHSKISQQRINSTHPFSAKKSLAWA